MILQCRREVEFRKRMLLLWQSGVPMSVEVLACPDCACGAQRAQSHEPTVRPSPSDLLLEQWTITAQSHRYVSKVSLRELWDLLIKKI